MLHHAMSRQRDPARSLLSVCHKIDLILYDHATASVMQATLVVSCACGGDFNAQLLGSLLDTPAEQLDLRLPVRVAVSLDDDGVEVHNLAGRLLMDTCRTGDYLPVVTSRLQPDRLPGTF